MKIDVDFPSCEMHGECVMGAPEVFDLQDDSDAVTVLDAAPPEALRPKVETAARLCPVAAIHITG